MYEELTPSQIEELHQRQLLNEWNNQQDNGNKD